MGKNKKRNSVRKTKTISPKEWDLARLKKIVQQFKSKKILVVGDVGIDRYTIGSVDRISPEAPVPIVHVQQVQLKLGLAANVADNIRCLGATPWMVGVVGRDTQAGVLKGLFNQEKISPNYLISDSSRQTVLKERVVSERQQLLRIDYENTHPVSAIVEDQLLKRIRFVLERSDAVILQDYAKGLVSEELSREMIALCAKQGRLLAVDPNSKTPLERYAGATFMTPNTKEAEALSGVKIVDFHSLMQAGDALVRTTRARYVVVTRGKEGMAVFPADLLEPVFFIPTYVREVYDVSGAGDTVISVMTLAMAAGATIVEAAIIGNLAAGVEVGKRGTATVSVPEIFEAMEYFYKAQ